MRFVYAPQSSRLRAGEGLPAVAVTMLEGRAMRG
jgi:hypothetical protein